MTKVLVIEDNAESRDTFLDTLEAEGFEAICAKNGRIGVQIAREQLPDVVICDIMMPELDGFGVLSALRQNPVTAIIPFIFLTAKATRLELRQGMLSGADDYLTKPSTPEELLEAIAIRLERQKALQQWCSGVYQSQSASADPESVASGTIFPTYPQLREVFDFIEANYHQPISLREVAQAVGYSAAYLTDLVRRQTGRTVNRWILERRMAEARRLLLETNQSVEQIALFLGYEYVGCFYRQFREHHKTTPQAWRNTQLNKSGLT